MRYVVADQLNKRIEIHRYRTLHNHRRKISAGSLPINKDHLLMKKLKSLLKHAQWYLHISKPVMLQQGMLVAKHRNQMRYISCFITAIP